MNNSEKNILCFDFEALKNNGDFGIPGNAVLRAYSVDDGIFNVVYEVPGNKNEYEYEGKTENIFEENNEDFCLGCYLESLENRIDELEEMIEYLVDEIEEINNSEYDDETYNDLLFLDSKCENLFKLDSECDCCGGDIFNNCTFNINIGDDFNKENIEDVFNAIASKLKNIGVK